eukprot:9502830-Karenia_brevis.AAC.1
MTPQSRRECIQATELFVSELQRMKLKFSHTKSVVGASLPSLAKAVSPGVTCIHLPYRRAVVKALHEWAAGGDLDLQLIVADAGKAGSVDPAFDAHWDVIRCYAMA